MVMRQLQALIAEHLPILTALRLAERDPLPWIVERDLNLFLTCGEEAFGHAILVCPSSGLQVKVAFTCKRRSFCPQCAWRRVEDRTHHLMNNVLAVCPYRQWVLTCPGELRKNLIYHPEVIKDVQSCFAAAVFAYLRGKAVELDPTLSPEMVHPGALLFGHPASASLAANMHFHCLAYDGVFVERVRGGELEFIPFERPTDDEIQKVAEDACRRICDVLARHEMWKEDDSVCPVVGVRGKVSMRVPRENQHRSWRTVWYVGRAVGTLDDVLFAPPGEPFSVFARDRVEQDDREGLENLVRYLLAPPFRLDQLTLDADGNLILELKRPRSDGTTHIKFAPEEFIEALAPLIRRPRKHAVWYHGVLARNARLRKKVVLQSTPTRPSKVEHVEKTPAEVAWKQLHTRADRETFLRCRQCKRHLLLMILVGPNLDYQDQRWIQPDTPEAPAAEPAFIGNTRQLQEPTPGGTCTSQNSLFRA